jgi:hypothetical protein
MPISSLSLVGNDGASFSAGTSFGKTDRKLIQSAKGQEKIIRAFDRTPFNFRVIFENGEDMDGDSGDNEMVDTYAGSMGAGIYQDKELDLYHGVEGSITVVLLGNLSPGDRKMPVTGWTLGHKIGHSIQDHMVQHTFRNDWGRYVRHIGYLLEMAYNVEFNKHEPTINLREAIRQSSIYQDDYFYAARFERMLTMKSARDRKLDNSFEVFAEIVAQFLITGAVTMRSDADLGNIVPMINHTLEKLFTSLNGCVMVEV